MKPTKDKQVTEPTDENPSKFCLGLCDHEFKCDSNGRPYVKCHGCKREIGKRD